MLGSNVLYADMPNGAMGSFSLDEMIAHSNVLNFNHH